MPLSNRGYRVEDLFFRPRSSNPTIEGQIRHNGSDLVGYFGGSVKSLTAGGSIANRAEAIDDRDFVTDYRNWGTATGNRDPYNPFALSAGTISNVIPALWVGQSLTSGAITIRSSTSANSGMNLGWAAFTSQNFILSSTQPSQVEWGFIVITTTDLVARIGAHNQLFSNAAPTNGIYVEQTGASLAFKTAKAGSVFTHGSAISVPANTCCIFQFKYNSPTSLTMTVYSAFGEFKGTVLGTVTITNSAHIPTTTDLGLTAQVYKTTVSGSATDLVVIFMSRIGLQKGFNHLVRAIGEDLNYWDFLVESDFFSASIDANYPFAGSPITSGTTATAGNATDTNKGKTQGVVRYSSGGGINNGYRWQTPFPINAAFGNNAVASDRFYRNCWAAFDLTAIRNVFGFSSNQDVGDPTNGVYFSQTNNVISAKVSVGGVVTTLAQTFTIPAAFVFLKMHIEIPAFSGSGSRNHPYRARFKISDINDIEVFSADHTGTIPDANTVLMYCGIVGQTTEAVAKTLGWIDYQAFGTMPAYRKQRERNNSAPIADFERWRAYSYYPNIAGAFDPCIMTALSTGTLSNTIPAWAQINAAHTPIAIRSSALINSGARVMLQTSEANIRFGQGFAWKFRFRDGLVGSIADRVSFVGSQNTLTVSEPTNGVYFRIDNLTATPKTAKSSVYTSGTTFLLSQNTLYLFDIEVNAAGTLATYTISDNNGSQLFQTTIATNIPNTTTEQHWSNVCSFRTAAVAAVDLLIHDSMGFGSPDAWLKATSAVTQDSQQPAINTIPKSLSTGFLHNDWVNNYYNMSTKCGDGTDGDLVVTSTVTLTKSVNYDRVYINGAGKIINRGFEFRARKVFIGTSTGGALCSSPFNNVQAGSGTNNVAGVAASATDHYARPPMGGSGVSVSSGNGGTAAGSAGGNIATAKTFCASVAAVGGAGGAGSSGAGGASGGAGALEPFLASFETDEFQMMNSALYGGDASSQADTTGNGGVQGTSGGGGGGDGTNAGGGGGAGGEGTAIGRWRIGELFISAFATAPIFDARGSRGGNGATRAVGNVGGGGGGGGGCGSCAIVIIGKVNGSMTNAISASGGAGGNGGNGFGTGAGGAGGAGGRGGKIYLRRVDTKTITIVDNTAQAGVAGNAASGITGGSGGAGHATTVNL